MKELTEKLDRLVKELERPETYKGEHKVIQRAMAKTEKRIKKAKKKAES